MTRIRRMNTDFFNAMGSSSLGVTCYLGRQYIQQKTILYEKFDFVFSGNIHNKLQQN